jgi:hypothetical protein
MKQILGKIKNKLQRNAIYFKVGLLIAFILIPISSVYAVDFASLLELLRLGLFAGSYLLSVIFSTIIEWLINPDTFKFITHPEVKKAWILIRDFVNLGLVVSIVVIAIGFILRLQSYGSQKTLMRLIFAALLVNFSLVIAGVIIDIAAIITNFLYKTLLKNVSFASVLFNVSGYKWLMETFQKGVGAENLWEAFGRFVGVVLRMIPIPFLSPALQASHAAHNLTALIIGGTFAIMLLIVLGALIFMLMVRVAMLWFLLVISPLAWVCWIFPALEKNWNRWWSYFLRWTFFVPIVVFFLGLGLQIMASETPNSPNFQGGGFLVQAYKFITSNSFLRGAISGTAPDLITQTMGIPRVIITICLLAMGLIIANEMSITFADSALNLAQSIYLKGLRTARGLGIRETKKWIGTRPFFRTLEQRFAGRRYLGGISRAIQSTRKIVSEDIEAAERELVPIRRDYGRLAQIASRHPDISYRIAATRYLANAGQINRLDPQIIRARLTESYNITPDVAESIFRRQPIELLPYWNQITGRTLTLQDALRRFSPAEISAMNISNQQLQQPTVLANLLLALGERRFINFVNQASDQQRQAIGEGLRALRNLIQPTARQTLASLFPNLSDQRTIISLTNRILANPSISPLV